MLPHTIREGDIMQASILSTRNPRPRGAARAVALLLALVLAGSLIAGCGAGAALESRDTLRAQVFETEQAFAATMAARDHAAFTRFLSDETVFFTGPQPLRGAAAVAEWWKKYYDKPQAPFSWKPESVEVLESGTLALSTGPVFDPTGTLVGTFTSIWRLEAPGVWRIIFDHGCDVCPAAK